MSPHILKACKRQSSRGANQDFPASFFVLIRDFYDFRFQLTNSLIIFEGDTSVNQCCVDFLLLITQRFRNCRKNHSSGGQGLKIELIKFFFEEVTHAVSFLYLKGKH